MNGTHDWQRSNSASVARRPSETLRSRRGGLVSGLVGLSFLLVCAAADAKETSAKLGEALIVAVSSAQCPVLMSEAGTTCPVARLGLRAACEEPSAAARVRRLEAVAAETEGGACSPAVDALVGVVRHVAPSGAETRRATRLAARGSTRGSPAEAPDFPNGAAIDRDRLETVGWVLEQLPDGLCGPMGTGGASPLFPTVCTLATNPHTVLTPGRLLRAAAIEDLRNLPRNLAAQLSRDGAIAEGLRMKVAAALVGFDHANRLLQKGVGPLSTLAEVVVLVLSADGRTELGETRLAGSGAVTAAVLWTLGMMANADDESLRTWGVEPSHLAAIRPDWVGAPEAVMDLAPALSRLILFEPALDRAAEASSETLLVVGLTLEELLGGGSARSFAGTSATAAPSTSDPKWSRSTLDTISRAVKLLHSGEFSAGFATLLMNRDVLLPGGRDPYLTGIRFAQTLVDLAEARTGDELAAAIEAAGAPPGSARIRRLRPAFSLSAQVGLAFGWEWVLKDRPDESGMPSRVSPCCVLGVSVPLVLSRSWPIKGNVMSVGVQLIDLGTLASFRLGVPDVPSAPDESTEFATSGPEVSLVQVIAPGISTSLQLGDSPLSVSISAAWHPDGRLVADGISLTATRYDVARVKMTISCELPLWTW